MLCFPTGCYCLLQNVVVFCEMLLCFPNGCCFLQNIVVFQNEVVFLKMLLFFSKLLLFFPKCCVFRNVVVFSEMLCSTKCCCFSNFLLFFLKCCVFQIVVVFSKMLLFSKKCCCFFQNVVVFPPSGPPYFCNNRVKHLCITECQTACVRLMETCSCRITGLALSGLRRNR